MMARWWTFVFLLLVVSPSALAEDPEWETRPDVETSPLGTFDLVYTPRAGGFSDELEIRIEFKGRAGAFQVLFTGSEATWALISPDERWIVVNSSDSGISGFMRFFERNADGEYTEKEVEVERRALAALMKSRGLKQTPRFDVFFCYADFWARDSGCLLGYVEGRMRGVMTMSRFYFVYDPAQDRLTLDLNLLNRGAFESGKVTTASNR